MDNKDYLHRVLDKISDHYISLLEYFSSKRDTEINHIHFGDCISFSLPKSKYEEYGIKYKNKIIISECYKCLYCTRIMDKMMIRSVFCVYSEKEEGKDEEE